MGHTGYMLLAKPVAVAVDDKGAVFVADTVRSEVIAFYPPSGNSTRRFRPSDRASYRPVALAVGESELYVADIAAHCIDIFSTGDGGHLGRFGRVGSEPGRFYFPTGLAKSADGKTLVSDMMNARVQVFDSDNNPVLSMGQAGNRYGDMGKPKHLAVGPDGTVFIADAEFAHVHLFNMRGELLMLLGGPEDENGGTPMPVGVAVATILPDHLTALVPDDFEAAYYLFVTNSVGRKRVSLFAMGSARNAGTSE
jgi:DNA-binding beta-propeller fold protein YncE